MCAHAAERPLSPPDLDSESSEPSPSDASALHRCLHARHARRELPLNVTVGQHFIAGAWREGSDGFDLRQRIEPFEPVGTWPRADEGLLVEALEAARAGRDAWLSLSTVERAACLQRVSEHLRSNPAWVQHLESYLGLTSSELANELAELRSTEPSSSAPRGGRAAEFGVPVGIVFAHWTDLVGGLLGRVREQLAHDRGVVVLSDSRWPAAADALGAALSAAGMPGGAVSIVHGVSGPLRDSLISKAAEEVGKEPEPFPRLRGLKLPLALDLRGPERGNRSFVVKLSSEVDEGLKRAALEVVDQAFGRATSLSGQRPGRVARVICHVRVFSKFCEHLVAAIESSPDIQRPLPQIDNEAINSVRAFWNLGLDEGATLIFGGEGFESAPGTRARDPRVWPAIYSNVDPEMALCRVREAVPVLCLIRAESDEAAEQLARDLD